MNNPDTDWIKEGVQAVVTVAKIFTSCGVRWANLRVDDHATTTSVRADCLHPLPPPLSPTAHRVVEAAMGYCEPYMKLIEEFIANSDHPPTKKLLIAVRAHLATLRPADPLAVAMEALRFACADFRFVPTTITLPFAQELAARADKARAAILLIERGGKREG